MLLPAILGGLRRVLDVFARVVMERVPFLAIRVV